MAGGAKNRYLVAYDYGQGAVWAYITAESPSQITDRFPDLSVVEDPPSWMTEEVRRTIEDRMNFDLENPSGWLAGFNERRRRPQT
jgi:hypothetical protein